MTGPLPPTKPDDLSTALPSDTEIEQWAARERRRREVWLRGPSETEKALWAQRERERRASAVRGGAPRAGRPSESYLRQLQLATEGALRLALNHSLRDVLQGLSQCGRDWEEEYNPPLDQ